ncbi:hypothetical protein SAMN04488112_106160 [Melghirimyces thermohalophilus]|uniref:Uncharacterized protein n=1 Tax=Melghirimyces thermohalophilus TaxID=1236220 RepID=A0A1G6KTP5_9BACL|nr:hypothetical protein SAMN04488112_106160 [Melghirimyces thermohalophilus]
MFYNRVKVAAFTRSAGPGAGRQSLGRFLAFIIFPLENNCKYNAPEVYASMFLCQKDGWQAILFTSMIGRRRRFFRVAGEGFGGKPPRILFFRPGEGLLFPRMTGVIDAQ